MSPRSLGRALRSFWATPISPVQRTGMHGQGLFPENVIPDKFLPYFTYHPWGTRGSSQQLLVQGQGLEHPWLLGHPCGPSQPSIHPHA